MAIFGELQKFGLDNLITLFVLDATSKGDQVYYFHAGANEAKGNIVWQGQEYIALPIEADGFEMSGTKFPRPKLKIANISGVFSTMFKNLGDLVGCKVIRKRTLSRYLDAVNFTDGNPNANPSEAFPDDIFYISSKTAENKVYVEVEMTSSLDLQGVMLPRRQVIADICPFVYKSEECGWIPVNFYNKKDEQVFTAAEDACSHKVSGCKRRFGENNDLRFGGFPGSALVDL